MTFTVHNAEPAETDIWEIFGYIARTDSTRRAKLILERLYKACASLESLPLRGRVLPELAGIAGMPFREIRCKPYRIVYEVVGRQVNVLGVFDGRRDLRDLFEERLLR